MISHMITRICGLIATVAFVADASGETVPSPVITEARLTAIAPLRSLHDLTPGLPQVENFTASETISLDAVPTPWPVIAEVENFTVSIEAGDISTTNWGGDHYYGATFSNTFASRKALLHATNQSVGTATSAPVRVPHAGTWYVCVRYEAAYRFETDFTLTVRQGAATRLTRVYGLRKTPKIWGFGWSALNHKIGGCTPDPTPECHWTWGATENWVWEYAAAELTEGDVTFEIAIANTTSSRDAGALLADRNIDAILLTDNMTDIEMREANEQQLALDGLFSQHDEVWMKVENKGDVNMSLSVPYSAYHSAYASQHLICIPYCKASNGKVYSSIAPLSIPVPARSTTPAWVEVGSRLDAFNDGTWMFTAKPMVRHQPDYKTPPYSIEFGVKETPTSAVESIGTFSNGNQLKGGLSASIQVVFDANTKATRRMRPTDVALGEALAEAAAGAVPPGGKPPALTPIFGYSFCKADVVRAIEPSCSLAASTSASFDGDLAEFLTYVPLSDTATGDPRKGDLKRKRSYFEARALIHNLTNLELILQNLTAAGVADDVLVVSMGDEISLAVPSDPATAQKLFAAWCAKNHIPVPGTFNTTYAGNAKLFWYSNLFSNSFGLTAMSGATSLLRKYLKNANVNKAVTMFRESAMTLPWGEDYSWQSPIGTQQMVYLLLDLFRAGLRGKTAPTESQMMFYAMAHAPGNVPTTWRRLFFGYLGHGMTFLNLYELRPCTMSYTENYVDTGYGMYSEIRTALAELSLFEDIIQGGSVVDGDVGLFASDAFDIWGPATPPSHYGQHLNTFLSAKRALYVALLHAELPVDVVVEADALDGTLAASYKYLFLADTHVSAKASAALAAWVSKGGVLVATAGAGMFDELNATNAVLQKLLGVEPVALVEPASSAVQYIKQDLTFASALGRVEWSDAAGTPGSAPVLGARAEFRVTAPAAAATTVLATFDDDARSAAAVMTAVGEGKALYFGFLPGLSYFLPAIPKRPTDRGATPSAFAHFVPSAFDAGVLELLLGAALAPGYARQVSCSNPLVHARAVAAPGTKGVAVVLVNWSGEDRVAGLNVTVRVAAVKQLGAAVKATLASGGAVTTHAATEDGWPWFSVEELGVADALILRA